MKAHKCTSCDNQTFQKEGVCVSCKLGLKQMYTELADLLQKDTKWSLQAAKIAHRR